MSTGFAAGTLVHTNEGPKPIEEIRVGDWVMSQAQDSDMSNRSHRPKEEYAYRPVSQIFTHDDQPICEVAYFQPGAFTVKGPLRVTPHHRIWAKGLRKGNYLSNPGWMPAGELTGGHTLAIGYFGNVIVRKVQPTDATMRVFNLSVNDFRTYFVDNLGVWVSE